MKKITKLLFLPVMMTSLSLTSCLSLLFGGINTDTIEKATIKYTYNDYVNHNYFDIDGTPVSGNPKILVVPVWFNDSANYIPVTKKSKVREDIEKTYFGSNNDTGWRSVKTYYQELSQNKMNLNGVVTDWYECGRSSSYFYTLDEGQNRTNLLVSEAVEWYKTSKGLTNLKDFDTDHNGYLDGVMLIYGCPDYATMLKDSAPNLWAYCYWLQNEDRNVNNPKPNVFFWASYDFMYGVTTAPSTYHGGDTNHCKLDTHTYIHEMGHMFGLEDYYDYSGQYSPAAGFSMQDMNVGSHDPYSVMALGWAEVYVPNSNCTLALKNFQDSHQLILLSDYFSNSPFDEYLLLELYSPTGLNNFDSTYQYSGMYPKGPSSSGIRLWHVDGRLLSVDKETGNINDYSTKINSNGYYVHAMSNTYHKADSDSESYISPLGEDFADYNILQLIRNNKSATYHHKEGFTAQDLFTSGDSFKMSSYSKQFVKGTKMNGGWNLGWSFTIEKLSSSAATIRFTKS